MIEPGRFIPQLTFQAVTFLATNAMSNPAQLFLIYMRSPWYQSSYHLSMASYQPLQGVPTQSLTPTLYPPSNEDRLTSSRTSFEPKVGEGSRPPRTPSPTPSETRELETGAVNWKRLSTRKFWFRKEWIGTLSLSSSAKVVLRFIGWIQCTMSY